MILDNKNTNFKVHKWIARYTKEGKFSLVTGYFTIGALAYLFDKINDWRLRNDQPVIIEQALIREKIDKI